MELGTCMQLPKKKGVRKNTSLGVKSKEGRVENELKPKTRV